MPYKSFSSVKRKAKERHLRRRGGIKPLILFKGKHKKEVQNLIFPTNKSSERLRFEQSEKRFTAQRW